jgi:hypothetical protein
MHLPLRPQGSASPSSSTTSCTIVVVGIFVVVVVVVVARLSFCVRQIRLYMYYVSSAFFIDFLIPISSAHPLLEEKLLHLF